MIDGYRINGGIERWRNISVDNGIEDVLVFLGLKIRPQTLPVLF